MPEEIEIKSYGIVGNIYIDGTDISNMCVVGEVKTREEDKANDLKPEILKTATAVLRSELIKHGDLYNGYLASIESALKENTHDYGDGYNEILLDVPNINELAENILKRIIGED